MTKKRIMCLMLLLLLFSFNQTFAQVCGDVNSSGSVDIVDALLIAQYYVGLNPSNFDPTIADVNADGFLDIVDALRVAQLYVGLISELSCSTSVTPGPTEPPVGSVSIACGSSSAVGSFIADQYYTGGTAYNNTNTVDVSMITDNTPPAALFNNERYGAMSYTIPGFTAGGTYAVTLYFAETYLTASGGRLFNVRINGTAVLTNFDIYSAAGGQNKAVAQVFTTTADGSGQIVVEFTSVTENPKINGISIQSGSAPTTGPTAVPTATPTAGPTGTCTNPKATPVNVNVNFTGSAFTGSHQVVVETDPGLPQFTIFRPKDLGAGKKYPIIAWGQGGCSTDGLTHSEHNGQMASNGYLLIADGTPNGSGGGCGSGYSMDLRGGVCLLNAIKWAIKENNDPCSQYYQSLDTTKTAAFGFSCGGIMAEGAGSSKDPVLTTFMLNSSGQTSLNQSVIDSFQTPVLFLEGGTSDMAYENGKRDYNAIKTGAVPAMFVSTNVGHGGTLGDDNGGAFGKVNLAWLNWWLKGDTGATGKGYLVGSTCSICSNSAWEMMSKNLP
jgi:hypothetical protein